MSCQGPFNLAYSCNRLAKMKTDTFGLYKGKLPKGIINKTYVQPIQSVDNEILVSHKLITSDIFLLLILLLLLIIVTSVLYQS